MPTGVLFPAPQKIPPQVLSIMKRVDNVGYANLPKELKGRRNVVVAPKKAQARFRSVTMQRHEVGTITLLCCSDSPCAFSPRTIRSTRIRRFPSAIENSRLSTRNSALRTLTLRQLHFRLSGEAQTLTVNYQILQQDPIQWSRDAHPKLLYQPCPPGHALYSAHETDCQITYHNRLLARALPFM